MEACCRACVYRGRYCHLRAHACGTKGQGAQVTVTGPHGQQLATAPLSPGVADNGSSGTAEECRFPFTIGHVRDGLSVYGLSVSHRGIVDFSRADLRHSTAMLILGDTDY